MRRERKVWGEWWLIRRDSTHATSILKLDKGFQCSWHRHQSKFNLFVVLRGKVGIVTKQLDESYPMTVLTTGEVFTTKPGEWHKFVVLEDSEMMEEMYVEYHESDIERDTLGGLVSMEDHTIGFSKDSPNVPVPPPPVGNPKLSKYGDI